MSQQLRDTIYEQLSAVSIIDPHTHINALNPASDTLADILGYHYYTELAHSAGMPVESIQESGINPREKVGRLVENLSTIENTIADRREFYNESANINNIGIEQFPDLIVARLFGFGPRDLLEFEASEIADVSVKQLFET